MHLLPGKPGIRSVPIPFSSPGRSLQESSEQMPNLQDSFRDSLLPKSYGPDTFMYAAPAAHVTAVLKNAVTPPHLPSFYHRGAKKRSRRLRQLPLNDLCVRYSLP